MSTEALLTEREVADMLGVSSHAVRKWRREGLIGFIKIANTVRFEPIEVRAFIERNRKPAAS